MRAWRVLIKHCSLCLSLSPQGPLRPHLVCDMWLKKKEKTLSFNAERLCVVVFAYWSTATTTERPDESAPIKSKQKPTPAHLLRSQRATPWKLSQNWTKSALLHATFRATGNKIATNVSAAHYRLVEVLQTIYTRKSFLNDSVNPKISCGLKISGNYRRICGPLINMSSFRSMSPFTGKH